MAFAVTFYNFTKKENSTARPAGTGRTFNCVIKRGSGLIAPKIELNIGLTTAPSWNYCYIENFGRYYFISEWYFENALWTANLTCDVLATYKPEIGASSLYVLRAANAYDGRIVDHLYPTKVNCDYDSTVDSTPWQGLTDGCYIIGVVSKTAVFGAVNYIAMTRAQLEVFMNGLASNGIINEDNGFDPSEFSQAFQLSIVNPIQYIKSCLFFPISASDIPGISLYGVPVFNYPIAAPCKLIGAIQKIYTYTFNTKKHPDTQSRGNYVNCAPYTKATLSFPPFGVIDLDTTVICDVESIEVQIRLDYVTGLGILEVWANDILLNKIDTQIGVPIQLSQMNPDIVGAAKGALNAVGSVAGSVAGFMTGNIAGGISAISGAVSGIGDAAMSMVPRAQTMGSSGSFAQLYENPRVDFQFFRPVNDDITHNGRPLCQVRNIANLGGYMLIQDGDVPINGTKEEAIQVRTMLESGFYYE